MVGFYRKHVPSFAKITSLLTNLTSTDVTFVSTPQCQKAFEHLRECLVNAPNLVKAQINQPFILTTNTSDTYVGAVLNQFKRDSTKKPIGYFSKKLSPCETKYRWPSGYDGLDLRGFDFTMLNVSSAIFSPAPYCISVVYRVQCLFVLRHFLAILAFATLLFHIMAPKKKASG